MLVWGWVPLSCGVPRPPQGVGLGSGQDGRRCSAWPWQGTSSFPRKQLQGGRNEERNAENVTHQQNRPRTVQCCGAAARPGAGQPLAAGHPKTPPGGSWCPPLRISPTASPCPCKGAGWELHSPAVGLEGQNPAVGLQGPPWSPAGGRATGEGTAGLAPGPQGARHPWLWAVAGWRSGAVAGTGGERAQDRQRELGPGGCCVLGRRAPSPHRQNRGCPGPLGTPERDHPEIRLCLRAQPQSAQPCVPELRVPKHPAPHPQPLRPRAPHPRAPSPAPSDPTSPHAGPPSRATPEHLNQGTGQIRHIPPWPSGLGGCWGPLGCPVHPPRGPLRPLSPLCWCPGASGAGTHQGGGLPRSGARRRAAAEPAALWLERGKREKGLFSINAAATGNSLEAAGGQRSPPEPMAAPSRRRTKHGAGVRPAPPGRWARPCCGAAPEQGVWLWAGSSGPHPGHDQPHGLTGLRVDLAKPPHVLHRNYAGTGV